MGFSLLKTFLICPSVRIGTHSQKMDLFSESLKLNIDLFYRTDMLYILQGFPLVFEVGFGHPKNIFLERHQRETWTPALRRHMISRGCWGSMLGLKTEWAGIFSGELLCSVCCYAVLTSHNNGETAVDGYNPALFWVLPVSWWCLAKLSLT